MSLSKRHYYTTWFIAGLTALAATGGLFMPSLYRDSSALIPVLRGQDAVTLLVVPLLLFTAFEAHHGSTRSLLIYIGLLGYILYTYTGAAFAYSFNEFILVYIALFALCIFTLVGVLIVLDIQNIRQTFDAATPRKPIIAFLLLIVFALGFGELAQIIPFYTTGELPQAMQLIGATTYFVYTLDLGLIVPLCFIAALWLWRDKAWGYVLAAAMLIKAATMGLALLSMNWFAIQAGQATDGLLPLWITIALGGLGLSFWLLKHCDSRRNTVATLSPIKVGR
jgi:hypothetical protein